MEIKTQTSSKATVLEFEQPLLNLADGTPITNASKTSDGFAMNIVIDGEAEDATTAEKDSLTHQGNGFYTVQLSDEHCGAGEEGKRISANMSITGARPVKTMKVRMVAWDPEKNEPAAGALTDEKFNESTNRYDWDFHPQVKDTATAADIRGVAFYENGKKVAPGRITEPKITVRSVVTTGDPTVLVNAATLLPAINADDSPTGQYVHSATGGARMTAGVKYEVKVTCKIDGVQVNAGAGGFPEKFDGRNA